MEACLLRGLLLLLGRFGAPNPSSRLAAGAPRRAIKGQTSRRAVLVVCVARAPAAPGCLARRELLARSGARSAIRTHRHARAARSSAWRRGRARWQRRAQSLRHLAQRLLAGTGSLSPPRHLLSGHLGHRASGALDGLGPGLVQHLAAAPGRHAGRARPAWPAIGRTPILSFVSPGFHFNRSTMNGGQPATMEVMYADSRKEALGRLESRRDLPVPPGRCYRATLLVPGLIARLTG